MWRLTLGLFFILLNNVLPSSAASMNWHAVNADPDHLMYGSADNVSVTGGSSRQPSEIHCALKAAQESSIAYCYNQEEKICMQFQELEDCKKESDGLLNETSWKCKLNRGNNIELLFSLFVMLNFNISFC